MDIKKILKGIGVVLLAIVIFYLGAEAGFRAKYYLDVWKNARKLDAFNKSLIQIMKNDTWGGKTPEETYNLFVDALKKEDVDLAVKYISLDIERQARYYKEFNDKKQKGGLKEYAEKLPGWKDFEQVKDDYSNSDNETIVRHVSYYPEAKIVNLPDGAGGYIKTELPAGNYVDYSITLVKNINNIWKISSF